MEYSSINKQRTFPESVPTEGTLNECPAAPTNAPFIKVFRSFPHLSTLYYLAPTLSCHSSFTNGLCFSAIPVFQLSLFFYPSLFSKSLLFTPLCHFSFYPHTFSSRFFTPSTLSHPSFQAAILFCPIPPLLFATTLFLFKIHCFNYTLYTIC